MGIISSKSPRMAYSDGELWVSAYDEAGRRCWVNEATRERTYRFFEGKPIRTTAIPAMLATTPNGTVSFPTHRGMTNNAYGTRNLMLSANAVPNAAPPTTHPGWAAMVPYQTSYQTGVFPVNPATERGIVISGPKEYYVRPSFKKDSWMWK